MPGKTSGTLEEMRGGMDEDARSGVEHEETRRTVKRATSEDLGRRLKGESPIVYGSDRHMALVQSGYPDFMTIEEAKEVIASPASTQEERQSARSFIRILGAKPVVVSTRRGWKRVKQGFSQ